MSSASTTMPGLVISLSAAASHVGGDAQQRLRDHRLGEVERHAAALRRDVQFLRHYPAAIPADAAAADVDPHQFLRRGAHRARAGRRDNAPAWPAGQRSAPRARRRSWRSARVPGGRPVLPGRAARPRRLPAQFRDLVPLACDARRSSPALRSGQVSSVHLIPDPRAMRAGSSATRGGVAQVGSAPLSLDCASAMQANPNGQRARGRHAGYGSATPAPALPPGRYRPIRAASRSRW